MPLEERITQDAACDDHSDRSCSRAFFIDLVRRHEPRTPGHSARHHVPSIQPTREHDLDDLVADVIRPGDAVHGHQRDRGCGHGADIVPVRVAGYVVVPPEVCVTYTLLVACSSAAASTRVTSASLDMFFHFASSAFSTPVLSFGQVLRYKCGNVRAC